MRYRASHPGRIAACDSCFARPPATSRRSAASSRCAPTPTSSRPHSLPAEVLLGPAPQCRSDNVFTEDAAQYLAGTWDSTPYHRIVRPHRLNEFMHLAGRQRAVRGPRWQRAVGGHRRCAVRAPGRTDRMGKQRSRGEVLRGPNRPGLNRRARCTMSPPLHHINTSPTPPASADVVVIGGGIIGVFTAYYLAQRGVSVALVEKGRIGAEQSSRNWGWCRQQNRDARELPMASKSLDLWERFAAESGEDTGFHRCGLLYLSNDEAELSALGQLARFCEDRRRDDPHAEQPRGRRAGAGDRPRLERRRLLAQRWHRRSWQGRAGRGSCAHEARWQRPPELRGPRHRDGRRTGQRRHHGSRGHQDQDGRARRRRLGVLVLPPAGHPFSAGLDPPIHPERVPCGTSLAGCPGDRGRVRHAPQRRTLRTGHQRPRARGRDAAVHAIRPAVRADVRQALAQPSSGRPGRHSGWP